ncbi:Serine carboxypeptidase-like 2 [Carex littledalei]|uniref:Serine carboxypeptidase-like 2 n=1 Tax=Carex littledalei TaxID=544730 RepID=A0A833QTW9_9POAL|nr:Serine carboxypeptidase-like 2 [Carex littledalei]
MAYSQQETKKCFLISLVFLLCCSPWHYVEVDEEKGVELFYYFVESERNPEKDPLLIWLTGGPGCSSLLGLTIEIGPLLFDLPNYVNGLPSINYKPDSWTQVSSVIFVDSPVGTGFSYSRTTEGFQTSDTETARQLLHFLYKWLEEHPKFKSNPLYICGSSYSGMIVPVLTLEISIAKESHGAPFNLKGYVLGNPITDMNFDKNAKVPFVHGMALISDELYESTKKSCSGNYMTPSNIHCAKYLDTVTEDSLYQLSNFWANNGTVRDALGIHKGTIVDWHRCTHLPYTSNVQSAVPYHRTITSKGYPTLIYSGDHDAMAPYVGTQAWIRSLNFSVIDNWRPWYSSGQVAGYDLFGLWF